MKLIRHRFWRGRNVGYDRRGHVDEDVAAIADGHRREILNLESDWINRVFKVNALSRNGKVQNGKIEEFLVFMSKIFLFFCFYSIHFWLTLMAVVDRALDLTLSYLYILTNRKWTNHDGDLMSSIQ